VAAWRAVDPRGSRHLDLLGAVVLQSPENSFVKRQEERRNKRKDPIKTRGWAEKESLEGP